MPNSLPHFGGTQVVVMAMSLNTHLHWAPTVIVLGVAGVQANSEVHRTQYPGPTRRMRSGDQGQVRQGTVIRKVFPLRTED
jgi:hypothetical protein